MRGRFKCCAGDAMSSSIGTAANENVKMAGLPVVVADRREAQTAIVKGKLLHETEAMQFYELDGKVFVVER
jgi:NADP-dependent 3-hydroxy acid dehydrogenase YdfG